jgi:hypothetical protein
MAPVPRISIGWNAADPALLSPDGFHTTPPALVAQDLARCERSLQQLQHVSP